MYRLIITFIVAIASATNAFSQSDTLLVSHPDEVKVITSGDSLCLTIAGKEKNPNFFYEKKVVMDNEKEQVTASSRNVRSGLGWDFSRIEDNTSCTQIELSLQPQLYAGWSFALGKPSDMKLKGWSTYEAGLDILHLGVMPGRKNWWVSLDWGILMSRYYLKDCMMQTAADGSVTISPYPDGSGNESSFFRTLSSSLTLMWHHHVGKKSSLGLGVSWISSSLDNCNYKTQYDLSDGTHIVDMNELPIRGNLFSIKAEYMFARHTGLYLRYTPMSILSKCKGPRFQQLNLGLQLKF